MTQQIITWDQYAKHTNNLDCWVLVDGQLYDTTTYLAEHPGGDEILLKYSGLDATQRFNSANHSQYAKSIRNARRVGKIEDVPMPQGHPSKVEQIKQEYSVIKKKREQERKNKIIQQMKNKDTSNYKFYSKAQIASHNTDKDCWIIYDNKVYDVTKYHSEHPGGSKYIVDLAGQDATQQFNKINHSSNAKTLRQKHFIGYLEGTEVAHKSKLPLLAALVALLVGGIYLASYLLK